MISITFKTLGGFLYVIMVLAACEEGSQDWILPSSRTYQVKAYINGYSLEDCSIMRQHDRIQPYFVHSVANDPDVEGLMVFLQTPEKTLVGKKTWYAINKSADNPSEELLPKQASLAEPETDLESGNANAIENWSEYRIIQVNRLDKQCPAFTVTEDLTVGLYFFVFQVLGEKDILYQIEKPVYYLGDLDFALEDIHSYLPGLVSHSYFIPPETRILLEAQVIADPQLDPYIIWYNGKKKIGSGRIGEGANRLIWQVPDQTGFYMVRAVIFPFPPQPQDNLVGETKEVSLPISSKSKSLGYFAPQADNLIHWYQFQNGLTDSKIPGDERNNLRPQNQGSPQWLPYMGRYGLAVGTEDRYLLPDTDFIFTPEEQGTGQFLFHLLPLLEGTIFKAHFQIFDRSSLTPVDSLALSLSLGQGKLLLALTLKGRTFEESLSLETLDPQELIAPWITITLEPSQIGAFLSLEGMETPELVLALEGRLTGAGTFQLGDPGGTPGIAAICDELGMSFTKRPLLEELKTEISPEIPERLAEKSAPHEAADRGLENPLEAGFF